MKSRFGLLMFSIIVIFLSESFYIPDGDTTVTDEYILIGWNDLGMHCANKYFQGIVVLPPYNNVTAQAIRKGNVTTLPEVITVGFHVIYEIPGNTYSVGKTNFWDYEDQIFGINLPDNIGLAGAGLSGEMNAVTDHFKVEGIPITPFQDNDLINEDPYQLALLTLTDNSNNILTTTQPVIPVSNEINCVSSGCHSSEMDILTNHSDEGGFNPNNTPILCASCHSSNALGLPGQPGLKSLSEAIHEKHKDKTNDCYKCHPGPNTQCHRDVMHIAGMVCQDCHGSMQEVAESIANGREPWFEEPSCGTTNCHGSNFAEEPGQLFRNSKGHGGLYCSACHGSPHAIFPTVLERDNLQNITLQGFAGTLQRCDVCHGTTPGQPGPHGIMAPPAITQADLKVYLEGPFNGSDMNPTLAANLELPLAQPFNGEPWNYPGVEFVSSIPNPDVVDWVLIELRETGGDAGSATEDKIIARRAGFLMSDGSVKDLNGMNLLEFPVPAYTNLYAVIYHRNHLGVMTALPLTKINDFYAYDFSTGADRVYGGLGGYNQLTSNIFGMVSGDGDASGTIDFSDLINSWSQQAGNSGYLPGDYDMNIEVENNDKNINWLPNLGKGTSIP